MAIILPKEVHVSKSNMFVDVCLHLAFFLGEIFRKTYSWKSCPRNVQNQIPIKTISTHFMNTIFNTSGVINIIVTFYVFTWKQIIIFVGVFLKLLSEIQQKLCPTQPPWHRRKTARKQHGECNVVKCNSLGTKHKRALKHFETQEVATKLPTLQFRHWAEHANLSERSQFVQ